MTAARNNPQVSSYCRAVPVHCFVVPLQRIEISKRRNGKTEQKNVTDDVGTEWNIQTPGLSLITLSFSSANGKDNRTEPSDEAKLTSTN